MELADGRERLRERQVTASAMTRMSTLVSTQTNHTPGGMRRNGYPEAAAPCTEQRLERSDGHEGVNHAAPVASTNQMSEIVQIA